MLPEHPLAFKRPDELNLDATPDDQLPVRILQAYLALARAQMINPEEPSDVTALTRSANTDQRMRQRILEEAILVLRGFSLLQAQVRTDIAQQMEGITMYEIIKTLREQVDKLTARLEQTEPKAR